MVDADHRPAGDHPGEHDDAVARRAAPATRGRRPRSDAAVPGGVRVRRRLERPGHHRGRRPAARPQRRDAAGGAGSAVGRRRDDGHERAATGASEEAGAHAADPRPGGAPERPPAAICGRPDGWGKPRCGASRMLTGAARSDGSTSRVLLPLTRGSRHLGPSGQPPGVWRGWTPGRRTTRCPRHNRESAAAGRAQTREAAMAVVSMKQLLDSGVHFGHQTRRWNPKMKRFIFTERNGIYIIDLQQTLGYIDNAYEFVKQTVAHGGSILFVGTKRQAQEVVAEQATRVGMPYVNQRWLGGMLTNFQTVLQAAAAPQGARGPRADRRAGQPLQEGAAGPQPREGQARAQPRRYPRHEEGAQRHLDRGHQEGAHRRRRGPQAEHPGRRDPRHQLRPRRGRLQDPGQRRRDPQHRRADPRDRRRRRRGPHGPLRRAGRRRSRRGRRRAGHRWRRAAGRLGARAPDRWRRRGRPGRRGRPRCRGRRPSRRRPLRPRQPLPDEAAAPAAGDRPRPRPDRPAPSPTGSGRGGAAARPHRLSHHRQTQRK